MTPDTAGSPADGKFDSERRQRRTPTSGSNRESSPWSNYGSSLVSEKLRENFSFILTEFCMTGVEQQRMMTVIGDAIYKNARKMNSDGQPEGWCYVPTLPTGRVSGTCLAMDFGCSDHYFRLSLYNVRPDSETNLEPTDTRAILLTPGMRRAEMSQFCDYVATCVRHMLLENKVNPSSEIKIYMGIAAGFDVMVKVQRDPVCATVRAVSKDYKMVGFIGHDFVPYFQDAFIRADVNIKIGTVINDTVGILLSGIYQVSCGSDPTVDCSIAVLCHRGGSNMAFLERQFGGGRSAIVNTIGDWIGAHGELNCMANTIEVHVRQTLNVPLRLEYIISGAWYPHLLSRTIQVLKDTSTIDIALPDYWESDKSQCFEIFALCDQWYAKELSDQDLTDKLRTLLDIQDLSFVAASAIAEVCNAIVGRTAEVTALGIVALCKKIYNKEFPRKVAIAYGGSLFVSVSQLKPQLEDWLRSLIPSNTQILLVHSDVLFGCAVTAIRSGLHDNCE